MIPCFLHQGEKRIYSLNDSEDMTTRRDGLFSSLRRIGLSTPSANLRLPLCQWRKPGCCSAHK